MTALLLILLFISCILSCYLLFKSTLSTGRKTLLIICRFGVVCLICLIFFQPSLKITRLASLKNTIPVLIDLSASMKLFNTDSLVSLFSTYDSVHPGKNGVGEPKFIFFGFGDSCRPIPDLQALQCNDRNSIFPQHFTQKQITDGRKILIISDGNWSNVVLEKNILHDKQCFFLPLRQTTHPSYILVSSPHALTSTLKDSLSTVSIMVQGFNAHQAPIVISCRRGQRILAEKNIPADSGFFTEEVLLPIRADKAGVFLLEVTAKLGDTIRSSSYILHDVKPHTFSASLYASRPSLDKRFLTLALARKAYWKTAPEISPDASDADVMVFFDWDAAAQNILATHKKPCAVFIGCLPGEKPEILDASAFTAFISPDFRHIFSTTIGSDLPPLPECLTYTVHPFDIQRVIISLHTAKETNESGAPGIPLLFEALIDERNVLVFAAREIWRWDFWPKSLENTKELLFFTDFIIDRMEELVHYNTNRHFFVYPLFSPVYETDSISFKAALPAYLNNLPAVEAGFSITGASGDTLFDSVFTIIPVLNHSITLKTPPLKQGVYQYSCMILSGGKKLHYSDSIRISTDNSELRILGQNTATLKEIAKPLALTDPNALADSFKDQNTVSHLMNETITQTIKINRSWLLLCLIMGFLALEWILRRTWRLD